MLLINPSNKWMFVCMHSGMISIKFCPCLLFCFFLITIMALNSFLMKLAYNTIWCFRYDWPFIFSHRQKGSERLFDTCLAMFEWTPCYISIIFHSIANHVSEHLSAFDI